MKRKLQAVLIAISIIVNMILVVLLYFTTNDKSKYEQEFLREVSFSVQRFEGYKENLDNAEYTTGIAHLYCAWSALSNIDEKEWTYQQADDFHRLWNNAVFYPERFQGNIDDIINILKQIKVDNDFNDIQALQELKEFNSAIMHSAK